MQLIDKLYGKNTNVEEILKAVEQAAKQCAVLVNINAQEYV
jgi:hypothetical protein